MVWVQERGREWSSRWPPGLPHCHGVAGRPRWPWAVSSRRRVAIGRSAPRRPGLCCRKAPTVCIWLSLPWLLMLAVQTVVVGSRWCGEDVEGGGRRCRVRAWGFLVIFFSRPAISHYLPPTAHHRTTNGHDELCSVAGCSIAPSLLFALRCPHGTLARVSNTGSQHFHDSHYS